MFVSLSKNKFTLCSKTRKQMFLLVCVRHVGAHPDELQHGVSIQSSINLGKTFLRISRIRVILSTQILARVFVYLPPFISKILDFICRMVLSLIFSLQSRRFLTKTRRYIDRGCHLEKQQKRLRGRGGGRREGRGGERRKRLPAKPMKLPNAP